MTSELESRVFGGLESFAAALWFTERACWYGFLYWLAFMVWLCAGNMPEALYDVPLSWPWARRS